MNNKPLDEIDVETALQSEEKWAAFVRNSERRLVELDLSDWSLEDIDFSKLDLEGASFNGATLVNCDFSRSNLYGADFTRATLEGCRFFASLMTHSSLHEAEILGCDFALTEMTGASAIDANLEYCDLSRSRGLSQVFLDQCVSDTTTDIPASLDYPGHWILEPEEREENEMLASLRAFRGDAVLLCSFDGTRVTSEETVVRDRDEVLSALAFLQKKLRYLVEDRFLHNEAPRVARAFNDYYEIITENAGEGRHRWPRKIFEIDEIQLGLEGNSLAAYVESARKDIEATSPDSLPILDQIVNAHHMLAANMERWRAFVSASIDARITEDHIESFRAISEGMQSATKDVNHFDESIPKTFSVLRRLLDHPFDTARAAVYGIVRAIESLFSAIFTFVRKLIVASGDEAISFGSKAGVRTVVVFLLGGGAVSALSYFPTLSSWHHAGVSVLRSLGLAP